MTGMSNNEASSSMSLTGIAPNVRGGVTRLRDIVKNV